MKDLWENQLKSLDIEPKVRLNSMIKQSLRIWQIIKQVYNQDYETAYNDINNNNNNNGFVRLTGVENRC